MTSRRRLAWALAAAAAVLFFGRVIALLYADSAWYTALGATPLWHEKVHDLAVIHLTSAVFAGVFAMLNLYAIRRSIVSLAFPRRLGNVEFGEEVPERTLDIAALILAIAVAIVMSFAVPSWPRLAALRAGPRFGETDPYFQMDLSFYTSWLPIETTMYVWSLTLLILVSALVISLYALTPSLKWQGRSFQVSVRVRRHLSVLASFVLLTMAWSYRLDGYELLIDGSGPDGLFSYVDHQWLLSAYLSLSIGTVAAAALVLFSGWMGHVKAGFFTVSTVLIFAIALDLVLPSVVRRLAETAAPVAHERAYVSTRAAFTARAYNLPRDSTSTAPTENNRFASFADSAKIARVMTIAKDSALVYPGAYGAALVRGVKNVAAPPLGGGFRRLASAWAEQRLDLLWNGAADDSHIARRRDVRDRVRALAPVFAQGSKVVPAYLGDTLTWVLELYSASRTYPLSKHYKLAGEERSYFRHSATALINSLTGRVTLVPDPAPDPIAMAWRARFPANIRAGAPDILDALTATPRIQSSPYQPGTASATDSVFKSEVTRLYLRMRGALAAGDLKSFGAAYDSLGMLIGR
jgi:uncharacterized membrane protein (UPF0182 family)